MKSPTTGSHLVLSLFRPIEYFAIINGMNRFIRALIVSDFLLYFSYGLLTPILAVFVTKQIPGATLETVGLATAIYWIAKSLATIPLARLMDSTDGEKDEFQFMFWGSLLMSITLMSMYLATTPDHIYIIQGLFGIFNSMAIPGWRILFTNHIDRGKTGYEWGLWDVAVSMGVGISAYVGSIIADLFGFGTLFLVVGGVGILGSLILIPLRKYTRTLSELKQLHRKMCDDMAEVSGMNKT